MHDGAAGIIGDIWIFGERSQLLSSQAKSAIDRQR